jgi:hypothetical protein
MWPPALPSARAIRNTAVLAAKTLCALASLVAVAAVIAAVWSAFVPGTANGPSDLVTGRGGVLSAAMDTFTPGEAARRVGLPNALFLAAFVALFLLPHRSELTLGSARDVLVLAVFFAVGATLLQGIGLAGPPAYGTLDVPLLIGGAASFLVIGISNFGGIWQDNRSVLRELALVAGLVAVGQLPRIFGGAFSLAGFYRYLFEIGVAYVGGFIAKITLYPEDFITFELPSELKRALFGLLAITVMLPFAAAGLTALAAGAYALVTLLTGGPAVTAAYPPFTAFAALLLPVGYVASVARAHPLDAVMLLCAVCGSVIRHGVEEAGIDLDGEPLILGLSLPLLGAVSAVVAAFAMALG